MAEGWKAAGQGVGECDLRLLAEAFRIIFVVKTVLGLLPPMAESKGRIMNKLGRGGKLWCVESQSAIPELLY